MPCSAFAVSWIGEIGAGSADLTAFSQPEPDRVIADDCEQDGDDNPHGCTGDLAIEAATQLKLVIDGSCLMDGTLSFVN
jgi:hypothetical protein